MMNNDVLRSVRYMLDLSEVRLAEIVALVGGAVSREDVAAFLKKDDEEGYRDCPDAVMAAFLDGLIVYRRGRDESRPAPPPETVVSNNVILKKLRVAFELREDDILALLESTGFKVGKPELSALFRKPGHANYRRCGDQLLRYFLKGLTQRLRG
ncbi:uncharacterized protein YehS (DUF1456 family) [Crenobacter luteus]|uniref:DUF1456 family protein n=1 Tax=Crenobacter luteus TaxID=1452487 RepID=UPI001045822C|nr:DUF1456 family protein [Crenobacter luteus]TCP15085.1 uncharacterized protein YehS (DUF1456 family) [Crenobacter luteus]